MIRAREESWATLGRPGVVCTWIPDNGLTKTLGQSKPMEALHPGPCNPSMLLGQCIAQEGSTLSHAQGDRDWLRLSAALPDHTA